MKIYAIIDRQTNAIVRKKTYTDARDAKLALKHHYGDRLDKYAIGCVEGPVKLAFTAEQNGNWTEVSE